MVKKSDGSADIRYHPEGIAFENISTTHYGAGPGHYKGNLNAFMENTEGVLNIFLMYSSNPYAPVGGVSMGGIESIANIFTGSNTTIPFLVTDNYYRSLDIPYVANNLLHEIGHTMGTHHTFGAETCTETDWDYLSDAYGTTATGTKSCPLTSGLEDVFMNYNAWGNYLTPLQIARWHLNAHFLGCRKYVYNTYPEDANHDHTGQGQLVALEIAKNETWDFDIKMYTDIVVKSGKKLTIKCRVLMPYHSNIIVEPGAELEIDGGIITSHHDTTLWFGVSVWGNAAKSQLTVSDQGLLTMKNGATISNAVRAVTVGDPVFQDNTRNGGIVRVTDANFINNRGGFQWNPYRNLAWEYKSGAWTRTLLMRNLGHITRTNFTLDDRIARDPVGQVAFAEVDGVSINSCRFTSTMPYTAKGERCLGGCPDNKAIASWNSTFLFNEWSDVSGSSTIPGYCSGFRQGILAHSFAATNNFSVRNSVFENNQIGIATLSVNNFTIKDNTFLIDNPISSGTEALGLQLNSSSMYRVYRNHFDQASAMKAIRTGVEVKQGGSDFNRIKNNTYTGLTIGNLSHLQNTNGFYDAFEPDEERSKGLEFTCNTHTDNGRCLHIKGYWDASGTAVDGIRRIQGSAKVPAGNSFNGTMYGFFRIYAQMRTNPGTGLAEYLTLPLDKYYYYDGAADQKPFVSKNVYITPTEFNNPCIVDEGSDITGGTAGTDGGAAEAARIRLTDAYADYSSGRFERLDQALLDMESPYAEVERSLLYMQEGRVQEGLVIYAGISQMPLTAREQNDFTQGATLMRLVADRYTQSLAPRWDSLGTDEADSLRYVRDHTAMWAHQRACAWLAYALGESCAIIMPGIEEDNEDGNTMRRAAEKQDAAALSIQPNPSGRDFEVRYTAGADLELVVSDALGRSVYSATLPATQSLHRIPAASWASGVYLYRVTGKDQTLYYGKLLRQ
jgi:hypothetical protein